MTLPVVETAVFVSSWLTERKDTAPHPEAAYRLAGLLHDLSQWFAQHPEQDLVVFWEGLTDILDFCSDGKWEEEQDPQANWVPDSQLVLDQLVAEGVLAPFKAPPPQLPYTSLPYDCLKQTVIQAAVEVMYDTDKADILSDCQFYTPAQWAERGEEFGLNSQLVLVHDGGWMSYMLNLGHEAYSLYDAFAARMQELLPDYHFEQCTNWYSALYYDKN